MTGLATAGSAAQRRPRGLSCAGHVPRAGCTCTPQGPAHVPSATGPTSLKTILDAGLDGSSTGLTAVLHVFPKKCR